jgi:hypothetical protein
VFVDVQVVTFHVLKLAVVLPVCDSGSEPGEKIRDGRSVIGFRFGDVFPRDLNIEVLSAGETKRGGEIDRLDGVRGLRGGNERKREHHERRETQKVNGILFRSHLLNTCSGVLLEIWTQMKFRQEIKPSRSGGSFGRLRRCSSVTARCGDAPCVAPRIRPKSLAAPSAAIYEMTSTAHFPSVTVTA